MCTRFPPPSSRWHITDQDHPKRLQRVSVMVLFIFGVLTRSKFHFFENVRIRDSFSVLNLVILRSVERPVVVVLRVFKRSGKEKVLFFSELTTGFSDDVDHFSVFFSDSMFLEEEWFFMGELLSLRGVSSFSWVIIFSFSTFLVSSFLISIFEAGSGFCIFSVWISFFHHLEMTRRVISTSIIPSGMLRTFV